MSFHSSCRELLSSISRSESSPFLAFAAAYGVSKALACMFTSDVSVKQQNRSLTSGFIVPKSTKRGRCPPARAM